MFSSPRAEEETAARVKLEKENRELHSQLQETQDDLESEKDARQKVERQRRQLNEVSLRTSDVIVAFCLVFSQAFFICTCTFRTMISNLFLFSRSGT